MEFVSPVKQASIRTRKDRLPVNLVPWGNQLTSLVPAPRGNVQVRYIIMYCWGVYVRWSV